jgi:hypothetical protein
MRRVGTARSGHPDLLSPLPWITYQVASRSAVLVVDPVEQLRELADLYRRGLLSREEFVRQRAKVLAV